MNTPNDQQPQYTIQQRIVFCAKLGIFCVASTCLIAVLPLYLIWANTPPPDYGTELEAILFAKVVVNERLGRPKDERID